YGDRKLYNQHVTTNAFKSCEEFVMYDEDGNITDVAYEMKLAKKKVDCNLPIQVGIAVYHMAKLQMLRFYYDFLLKYIPRNKFQLIETDTDSYYMSFAAPIDKSTGNEMTVSEVVK